MAVLSDSQIKDYLNCSVVKVPHHGSMHSAPLDICEIIKPELIASISRIILGMRKPDLAVSGNPNRKRREINRITFTTDR